MTTEDQELKKAGLKVTLLRVKILKILENCADCHMTAADIYQSLRDADEAVCITTVYRVLTQFEPACLIYSHNFDTGPAVYELDRGEHHDHMVCTETGAVIEFHDAEIEKLQEKIANQNGYELVGHSLVLYVKPIV